MESPTALFGATHGGWVSLEKFNKTKTVGVLGGRLAAAKGGAETAGIYRVIPGNWACLKEVRMDGWRALVAAPREPLRDSLGALPFWRSRAVGSRSGTAHSPPPSLRAGGCSPTCPPDWRRIALTVACMGSTVTAARSPVPSACLPKSGRPRIFHSAARRVGFAVRLCRPLAGPGTHVAQHSGRHCIGRHD